MNAHTLQGLRVLVTRAEHQAGPILALLRAAGAIPLQLPALEIAPPHDTESLRALGRRLDHYDIAIFVSPNAVRGALKWLGRRLPPAMTIAAVGPGTTKVLFDAGYSDVVVPSSEFNSEALLEMRALRNVAGKKVVIFRGDGGRGLLREVLVTRGAQVEYAEVYRRDMPGAPDPQVRRALRERNVDAVMASSSLALEQLVKLCGDELRAGLLQAQLVVASERMIKLAESLGFRPPLVATEPGDQAMFDALITWRAHRPSQETC